MTDLIPSHAFLAPHHDDSFVALPDECRKLVVSRLVAMQTVFSAASIERGVKLAARPGERGFGRGTLRKLAYLLKLKNWNWKCLVDRASAGPDWHHGLEGEGFRKEFCEFLGSGWSRRQRGKFRSFYAQTLIPQWNRWRAGEAQCAIPGYRDCPDPDPRTDLPAGWTEGNLRRIAMRHASAAARKLINVGTHAAQEFTYKVPKTREGVEVGRIVIPDDCWNDFRIIWRGRGSRILSLHLLDLASGCNVLRGHKPTREGEDGIEERLKEREMIFLLDAYFSTVGYHPDGTLIPCEKSTATVRPADEKILDDISHGKITVQRGPSGGGPGLAALFTGPGGGNPRWKASIESSFNLLQNRCDDMLDFPGQTGKNSRLDKPEGLELMERSDEALFKAMQILTPECRKLIRFQLLPYEKAAPAIDAVCEFINSRRDHQLNQWRECGNVVPAFRLSASTPWFPSDYLDRLTAAQQEHLMFKLRAEPSLTGEITLSPAEVFARGAGRLKKFTPAQRALLMANAPGEESSVRRGVLAMEIPELDQDKPVVFGPVVRAFDGSERVMANDEKFLRRVNHFDPRVCWLYDARGGCVGWAPARYNAAPYGDARSLEEHFKAKSKSFAPVLAEARNHAAAITRRRLKDVESNAGVFASQSQEKNNFADAADAALQRASQL